ncbi:CHAP domain-containing protein, partial [bacterium]|nr:CHAP domain-containing protein [bacterium]
KMYNFTGGRSGSNIFSSSGDTIGYLPKMYNFTGGTSRNIFSGCGSNGSSYNFTGNIFASNTSSPLSAIKSGNTSTTTGITKIASLTNTSAANKSAKTNNISDNFSINTSKIPKMKSALKTSISQECINTAVTYIGDSEDNGRAAKFTKTHNCPNPKEWCADFVTYVTYEACNRQGKTPPAGFGSHDVRTMKNWAIKNGYFVRTSNIADNGKYFISMNIKPGNIIILNENGASHTGFVERVDWDGTIHTVEGNRDDKVTRAAYEPSSKDYKNISGFIQLA